MFHYVFNENDVYIMEMAKQKKIVRMRASQPRQTQNKQI